MPLNPPAQVVRDTISETHVVEEYADDVVVPVARGQVQRGLGLVGRGAHVRARLQQLADRRRLPVRRRPHQRRLAARVAHLHHLARDLGGGQLALTRPLGGGPVNAGVTTSRCIRR